MKHRVTSIILLAFLSVSVVSIVPALPATNTDGDVVSTPSTPLNDVPEDIEPKVKDLLADEQQTKYPADTDIGKALGNRENLYSKVFEPWKSKAAIHSVAYHEETGFLALGGGYLYDNEIHIYRLNTETGYFDKVWDSGDGIIQSDVLSLDFADTDLNDFLEIVAGSSDGHFYVFEQRHIYDPETNTENMFDHVYTSPWMFRVFDVEVEDVDKDYRPDIIAGTWEGVYLFEYDTHSGYPFTEEHWIEYRRVWHSGSLNGERVYSIEAGDSNNNGLPEIIAGTREGTVYVFENDGLTTIINGQPFPLVQDNAYYLNWTSENYTWTPIRDMALGELDGTSGDEIALVASGQGILTLDWNSNRRTYDYEKVYKEYAEWETFGHWALDYWVDKVVQAKNVTYHDPNNASIVESEPINYVWGGSYFIPNASVYPYNTGMAWETDGNYSTFDSSIAGVDNATAIVDFGKDEEGTGGANSMPDIIMAFRNTLSTDVLDDLNFSVGQSSTDFEQISADRFTIDGNLLRIDVDDALQRRKWDWFRYAKISVFNGATYEINSLELQQVYNLLTDALSVTIGPLRRNAYAYFSGTEESDKIIAGTATGKYIGISYDSMNDDFDIIFDSGEDERYTEGTGIWDLVNVQTMTDVPIWRYLFNPNPDGFVPPLFQIPSGKAYTSWSYGRHNLLGAPNYFVGTNESEIAALNMLGQMDSEINSYLSPVNTYLSGAGSEKPSVAVEMPFIDTNQFSRMPVVAVSSYDPGVNPTWSAASLSTAKINFFYRSTQNTSAPFSERVSISDVDTTGAITELLGVSQTTPKMHFVDVDGDEDKDMVFTNGRVYLARNLLQENGGYTNDLSLSIVHDYFKGINDVAPGKGWGQPHMFDLDDDGDLDIIMNYVDRAGATAFLNEGTEQNPHWVEDDNIFSNNRPQTSLRYNNFTDIRIVPTGKGYTLDVYADVNNFDVDVDYTMVAYDLDNSYTLWAEPIFDAVDSYIAATYPRVVRTEMSLMYGGGQDFLNFGFRIRESWSTDDDLDEWTLTVDSGDLDDDDNGEIVIGDYDNNVYVFENLVNNTYKRMYQSFDLNHTVTTDESPYLYDELEGISGEFTRRIWDHAKHLLAGVDLDKDGLKEFIVSSGLQLYVFEDMNLTGGDQMEFVYSIDLRNSEFVGEPGWNQVEEITAIAQGNDLDYDSRKELIVGAGPYLFVFNVPNNDFNGTEKNDYFVTQPSLDGRYYLLGNPYSDKYEYASIQTIAVGDTDNDAYREIILGGTNDTRYQRETGFAYIYESQGGTFHKVWEAPPEVVKWNPVSVIKIDDQDYDSYQEIIIGHTKGFDIWEWIPATDSKYQKTEYVTASPNYPIIPVNHTLRGTESFDITDRAHSSLTNGRGSFSNYVMHVYTNETIPSTETNEIQESKLYWKKYDKTTGEWSFGQPLYANPYGEKGELGHDDQPTVTTTDAGEIYAAWRVVDEFGDWYLYAAKFDIATETWQDPLRLTSGVGYEYRHYPEIFEFNSTHMGIAYVKRIIWGSDVIPISSVLYFSKGMTAGVTGHEIYFKQVGDLWVHSISITRTDEGNFILAMAAENRGLNKLDYDIWTLELNGSMWAGNNSIHQATSSRNDELFPDIDQLESEDNSLVVIYESVTSPYERRIGMAASTDGGLSWGHQDNLNVIPKFVERIEHLDTGQVSYQWDTSVYTGLRSFSPTVVAMDGEGFMYAFVWTFSEAQINFADYTFNLGWPMYGINPQSDWTGNHLGPVKDLDTGDSDKDGRKEIVAGWDNQVGSYELKSSTNETGFMTYREVWLSETYENSFNGLTVYDSNGNGWPEIAVATGRGDVFLYEYRKPSSGATDLVFPEQTLNTSVGIYGSLLTINKWDFDADSKEEILLGSQINGSLMAIDDDGTTLWENTDATGRYFWIDLIDLNNDTAPEVIGRSQDTHLYAIDGSTGNQLWNYSAGSVYIYGVDGGDLTGSADTELTIGLSNGSLVVLSNQGDVIASHNVAGSEIYGVELGRFTESNTTLAAFGTYGGEFTVVNPLNGTTVYTASNIIRGGSWPSEIHAYDFDEDGVKELVFGDEEIRILSLTTGEIYFNSTAYGDIHHDIFIEDFDGDTNVEIVSFTQYNGVFMVEPKGGVTQWHYDPEISVLQDIDVGYLGGTGTLDIAVVSSGGYTVALDGKNGIPMWFHELSELYIGGVAANLTGGKYDRLAGSSTSGRVFGFTSQEQPAPVLEPAWVAHSEYITFNTGKETLDQGIAEDFNGDAVDEILVSNFDRHLNLWNATTGELIWNVSFNEGIDSIRVGNVDGSGYLDVGVLLNELFVIVKGESGANITEFQVPDGFQVADFYIDEFNAGHTGDELAVTYERYLPYLGYVAWYDDSGSEMYRSKQNVTNWGNSMAIGRFTNSGTLDVAIGGYNNIVKVFRGTDGSYVQEYNLGDYIYEIVPGYFDGDNYEDIALRGSDYDITVVEQAGNSMLFDVPVDSRFRSYHAADVVAGDGVDELLVNIEELGIIGYDNAVNEVWRFDSATTLPEQLASVRISDWGSDGVEDVVFTNWNYINVINGSTQNLAWHYLGSDGVYDPMIGNFDSASTPEDIAYLSDSKVVIVSGSETPLTSPSSPEAAELEPSIIEQIASTSIAVTPLILLMVAPLSIYWRRKEEK
ncbi:MAG: PQQ-binding-like beta-propeller repeat protein [Candidatus Lokiarchaeota archaeon]|nr:PQQ-binding-like beta-propeller repeat protein [Candidatus Lokiarchaeota archaeon]